MSASNQFQVTSEANWTTMASEIVESFAAIAQEADWTLPHASAKLIATSHAGSRGLINSPSLKVSTNITHALSAAEHPDNGGLAAYRATVGPFVSAHGRLAPIGGWIERPSQTNDDWLRVSEFVRNNQPAFSARRTFSRVSYFLTPSSFLQLGRVDDVFYYWIRYERAQYVDGATRRATVAGAPLEGTFGYVAITRSPGAPFLNDAGDITAVPLSAVLSPGFEITAGSTVFLPIALQFISSQNVAAADAAFVGMSTRVISTAFAGAGEFDVPNASLSEWLGTRDPENTRTQLVPVALTNQTPTTVATPAPLEIVKPPHKISPGIIAAIVIGALVLIAVIVAVIVGVVVYIRKRRA